MKCNAYLGTVEMWQFKCIKCMCVMRCWCVKDSWEAALAGCVWRRVFRQGDASDASLCAGSNTGTVVSYHWRDVSTSGQLRWTVCHLRLSYCACVCGGVYVCVGVCVWNIWTSRTVAAQVRDFIFCMVERYILLHSFQFCPTHLALCLPLHTEDTWDRHTHSLT